MVKLLLDYEIIDIDINCKCVINCLGKHILTFNCKTKYEDRAEETINEVFTDWLINGGSLKDAIKRQGCDYNVN